MKQRWEKNWQAENNKSKNNDKGGEWSKTAERTWKKNLVIKVHQVLSRLEWMWIVVDSSLATEASKEYWTTYIRHNWSWNWIGVLLCLPKQNTLEDNSFNKPKWSAGRHKTCLWKELPDQSNQNQDGYGTGFAGSHHWSQTFVHTDTPPFSPLSQFREAGLHTHTKARVYLVDEKLCPDRWLEASSAKRKKRAIFSVHVFFQWSLVC